MENELMFDTAKKFYEKVKDLKRYKLTSEKSELPSNLPDWGIGIMYEKGENAFGDEKITYITYNKNLGNLGKRLEEHFLMRNKSNRRSSLRNHIARALIAKNSDDSNLFDLWNGNRETRKEKTSILKANNQKYVKDKLEEYEDLVDEYLQGKFSFSIIPVSDKKDQRRLRSRIISTLAQAKSIPISEKWLGKFAVDGEASQISDNGIWNIEYSKDEIFDDEDFNLLDECLKL
ncbi:MAG: hypothetical protein IJP90_04400 [Treponema sp.]|nr:hypothetical protein [Treponema sp.]